MYILRVEHPVPNFDGWKQAFDSRPVGWEKSGVRRYRVLRAVDDANYVIMKVSKLKGDPAVSLQAACF